MESIKDWQKNNAPDDSLIYKDYCLSQVIFVRDNIAGIIAENYEEYKDLIKVCGTHVSKSVKLPVFYIEKPGIKFVLRNNFYNWNVSVDSIKDLNCNFLNIFPEEDLSYCFYEGFPKEYIYNEAYNKNNKKFDCCILDDYRLYMFFWIIRESFGWKYKSAFEA